MFPNQGLAPCAGDSPSNHYMMDLAMHSHSTFNTQQQLAETNPRMDVCLGTNPAAFPSYMPWTGFGPSHVQCVPWPQQQLLHNFQAPLPRGPPPTGHVQTIEGLKDQRLQRGDWSCGICKNQNNFANRITCYRCNSPRPPRQISGAGGPQWVDNKTIFANLCNTKDNDSLWNSPGHSTDMVDQQHFAADEQTPQIEHDLLLEQEKQFDFMFDKWESNFEQWKSDNETNPDWDYVKNHIDEMNKLHEKMLIRREALKKKREQLLGIPDVSKVPHAKLTKNEGLKKLMEAKWSKEVDGSKTSSASCPHPTRPEEGKELYIQRESRESLSWSKSPSTLNNFLFERRRPKRRAEEYWNPQHKNVIDYGCSIPSKIAKVIDYAHGDCIGDTDGKNLCLISHENGVITDGDTSSSSSKPFPRSNEMSATSSKPIPKWDEPLVKIRRIEQKGSVINVADLLDPPGRYMRPPKIVLILRGIPGSGKTHFARNIRAKESDLGSDAPRILDLDSYFEADGEYDYDESMAGIYRQIFVKAFKKNIDDALFSFIIVDSVNDKTDYYHEMWSYAKEKGFEVYIAEFLCDPKRGAKRNIHTRCSEDVQRIHDGWEATPCYMNRLDLSMHLKNMGEIEQVEMDEAFADSKSIDKVDEDSLTSKSQFKISKWEVMENEQKLAQLDGISGRHLNRQMSPKHESIENWLEDHGDSDSNFNDRKKVRWADIEERRKQLRSREFGFVVGSRTNWGDYVTDTVDAKRALEKTRLIPNRLGEL